MKLFELLGVITVNNNDANAKIDETSGKTEELHSKLKSGMETVGTWALKFTAAAATAAIGVGTAVTKIITSTMNAGDTIDKMSQRLGMSRKAYQEWDFVMSQCGLTMEQMESGMMALTNKMKEAADPNSEASKAFRMLGVAVTDSEGNLRSVNAVFEETVAAMTMIENEGEKLALADMLFAGSGQLMMPLLNTAYDEIVKLKEKANELNMIMSDADVDAAVAFTDTMDTFKRAYGSLSRDLGTALIPILDKFFNFLLERFPEIKESLDGFITFLDENSDSITEWALSLGNFTVEAFNGFLDMLKWLITNKDAVATAFSVIGGAIALHFAAAHPYLAAIVAAVSALQYIIDNPKESDDNPYVASEQGERFQAASPEPSDDVPSDAKHIRELLARIGYSNLYYYLGMGNVLSTEQMTDEELVEWYRWQNKGVFNRAGAGFKSTYGLSIPFMGEDGIIRYVDNPQGDEEPPFELFEDWGNDNNPDYVDEHNAGISSKNEVDKYRKEYGDDWFDHWYEKYKDIVDPDIVNQVIEENDIPTFGSMPMLNTLANSLMMGSNTAFGGIGENTNALVALITNLNEKLDTVINQQAQGKTIVLNTGALVGGIGNAMDKFLGNKVNDKARGQG